MSFFYFPMSQLTIYHIAAFTDLQSPRRSYAWVNTTDLSLKSIDDRPSQGCSCGV